MRPAAVATLLLVSCAGKAIAQEPPRFDIEATCRSAPSLLPQDRDTYATCMRAEHNARVMLERRWSGVSAEHRHTCAAETTVGGGKPSYVEVLTCIEMYAGTPSRRSQCGATDCLNCSFAP